MKITKSKLKQIIKEELDNVLEESSWSGSGPIKEPTAIDEQDYGEVRGDPNKGVPLELDGLAKQIREVGDWIKKDKRSKRNLHNALRFLYDGAVKIENAARISRGLGARIRPRIPKEE